MSIVKDEVLTAEQLTLITNAATKLPRRWRSKFELVVATHLAKYKPPISDITVHAVIIAAKRSVCVGIGTPSVER